MPNNVKSLCKHVNKLIKKSLLSMGIKTRSIRIKYNQHTHEINVHTRVEIPTFNHNSTHVDLLSIEYVIRHILKACSCNEWSKQHLSEVRSKILYYNTNCIDK